MKKTISLLLCLVILLSVGLPAAFAIGELASIETEMSTAASPAFARAGLTSSADSKSVDSPLGQIIAQGMSARFFVLIGLIMLEGVVSLELLRRRCCEGKAV